ncbi:MAG: CinA family nicotinamide mononucleotide deamidase-related protein [Candidatus Rokubacteria bacterium]|nr:CinA family nicotinamide mononucleotide deamidase-related protein [Candidatus Rokubacteria bacterium]
MGIQLITVSASLLQGEGTDEAAQAVAHLCFARGLPIAGRQIIGEDEGEVEAALRLGLERGQLVIVLSGSGGSAGEPVRRALSRVLGLRLILNEKILQALQTHYARQERAMPRRAERLALVPQGAILLETAEGEPGLLLDTESVAVALLPLDPESAVTLAVNQLFPLLQERLASRLTTLVRTLKVVGPDIGEVEERLGDWLAGRADCTVLCLPQLGEVWVRITVRGSAGVAEAALDEVEAALSERLGQDCYGRDQEMLEAVVGRLLIDRGLTLAVAESCTGGLLGHRLTEVSGSSRYFERGIVTYSNEAKTALLGVSKAILTRHGAVSAQCASAMAKGIRAKAKTDLGLAVTGIAGPDGGSEEKPVGTVFLALATADDVKTERRRFRGNRSQNKWLSAQFALDLLRRHLL